MLLEEEGMKRGGGGEQVPVPSQACLAYEMLCVLNAIFSS